MDVYIYQEFFLRVKKVDVTMLCKGAMVYINYTTDI